MPNHRLTLEYQGRRHSDKDDDQIEATIAAALDGRTVEGTETKVHVSRNHIWIQVTAAGSFSLDQISGFAQNMVAADFDIIPNGFEMKAQPA